MHSLGLLSLSAWAMTALAWPASRADTTVSKLMPRAGRRLPAENPMPSSSEVREPWPPGTDRGYPEGYWEARQLPPDQEPLALDDTPLYPFEEPQRKDPPAGWKDQIERALKCIDDSWYEWTLTSRKFPSHWAHHDDPEEVREVLQELDHHRSVQIIEDCRKANELPGPKGIHQGSLQYLKRALFGSRAVGWEKRLGRPRKGETPSESTTMQLRKESPNFSFARPNDLVRQVASSIHRSWDQNTQTKLSVNRRRPSLSPFNGNPFAAFRDVPPNRLPVVLP